MSSHPQERRLPPQRRLFALTESMYGRLLISISPLNLEITICTLKGVNGYSAFSFLPAVSPTMELSRIIGRQQPARPAGE
jgi:hypothetical protein